MKKNLLWGRIDQNLPQWCHCNPVTREPRSTKKNNRQCHATVTPHSRSELWHWNPTTLAVSAVWVLEHRFARYRGQVSTGSFCPYSVRWLTALWGRNSSILCTKGQNSWARYWGGINVRGSQNNLPSEKLQRLQVTGLRRCWDLWMGCWWGFARLMKDFQNFGDFIALSIGNSSSQESSN